MNLDNFIFYIGLKITLQKDRTYDTIFSIYKDFSECKENRELKKYAGGVPKGTTVIPVVALVFYTGTKPWDGSKSIYEMLNVPVGTKQLLLQAVPDYAINLMDARHMTAEQINEFEGDLKALLLML